VNFKFYLCLQIKIMSPKQVKNSFLQAEHGQTI